MGVKIQLWEILEERNMKEGLAHMGEKIQNGGDLEASQLGQMLRLPQKSIG